MVRYGNVFGSRGSIAPFFANLIKNKNDTLPITDTRMTRFNITLEESVKFVDQSINYMNGGELFIPKLNAYRILDLATAFNSKFKIKILGIRPGEKFMKV